MNQTKLRITGRQHKALYQHLFPGDGKEAVALALCGVGYFPNETEISHQVICVHRILPIPYKDCSVRKENQVTWSTDILHNLIPEVKHKKMVILKIHSHPTGINQFSFFDDESDRDLFKGLSGWMDTDFPGISAIMLPDGRIIARMVSSGGHFRDVSSISIAGPDINIWQSNSTENEEVPEYKIRTAQTFGKGTTEKLSRLSIGVVGISGTGSPVVEQLHRLGVGELVLVDGDVIEEKNVGRIYNSTLSDAKEARLKVHMMAAAILKTGLPTKVVRIPKDLFHPEVVRRLAQCDVIFGCMDSLDGRDLLNRLCSYYCIPYFDLGVRLDADGQGGVDQVCGTVHYLQPDGSSLLSRGVYTEEELRASNLLRSDPEHYREQVASKYIKGVQEDRPAVISVNTLVASLAVNDFLGRIHPFRDDSNEEIATLRVSLTQTRLIPEEEGEPCSNLIKVAGRGDSQPLLNMPILSERKS